jgi:ligand-binding sensor domain-containing protein/signal transduction histidine kinase
MKPPSSLFAWLMGFAILLGSNLNAPALGGAQPAAAGSSDYLVHVWRSEDGLPQNSVNCLAQTPDGYLWIGTRSGGLARFDGMRFVTFNPQTTPELKDVEFETLSVDSRGTLWITAGNESVASVRNGKFKLVRERNATPRFHPLSIIAEDSDAIYQAAYSPAVFRVPREARVNEVRRIELTPSPLGPFPTPLMQARDGALWYMTDQRDLARIQISNDGAVNSSVFNLGSPAQVLAKDVEGQLWVATGNSFGTITRNGFIQREPSNGPPPREVRQIIPAHDNSLWVWDERHLRKMSGCRWTLEVPGFHPVGRDLQFFADKRGGLWAIEYGVGLWHVRPDGSSVLLTPQQGLPSTLITSWLEDNEGNIWIGTKEAGLARLRQSWFKQFTAADGIPGDVAQSVCEDVNGTVWVGTAAGGLAHKEGDRFLPVPLPSNPGAPVESVTVFPDATNGIWIGTVRGSVFRYARGEVTRPFDPGQLRDRVADVVLQEKSGRVWFGNGSGAYYFENGALTTFGRARGFVEDLGVRALAEGPGGTLWFGTEPGDLWQLSNGALTRFHPDPQWPEARVSALLPDSDGSVWIGTLGGGLLRFANGKFTRITTQQGLPDNSITQLLSDEDGNLWGGSYAGVFRASKKDLKNLAAGVVQEIAFSVHGHFDGLPAQAYSGWYQPSCWRSHDGHLWFTTVKGLVTFDPRGVAVNHRPPPVLIEQMRVDGKSLAIPNEAPRASAALPALRIEPGRHYVEFGFTGINFAAPDKVRFKWRLEGAEKQWREAVNQRSVGYGPLLPGDYTFRVLAANSDGIWNETGAHLGFIILPWFWETLWFQGSAAVAVCLGLAFAVAWTLRRGHRLELERLARTHEMERERSRIAQDLHDDLGTSLTRISLLSSLLERGELAAADLRSLTQEIRGTSRAMVAALNEIVWAVNPKNDSLNELVGYLGNFAEAFFRPGSIRCRLDIPSDIPERSLASEVRHGIFLAFKEALNNAARHSRASEIRVKVRFQNDDLEIEIRDDGAGFNPSANPSGNGLANMRQRMEKMGGTCQICCAAQGTTVMFRLRVH